MLTDEDFQLKLKFKQIEIPIYPVIFMAYSWEQGIIHSIPC